MICVCCVWVFWFFIIDIALSWCVLHRFTSHDWLQVIDIPMWFVCLWILEEPWLSLDHQHILHDVSMSSFLRGWRHFEYLQIIETAFIWRCFGLVPRHEHPQIIANTAVWLEWLCLVSKMLEDAAWAMNPCGILNARWLKSRVHCFRGAGGSTSTSKSLSMQPDSCVCICSERGKPQDH